MKMKKGSHKKDINGPRRRRIQNILKKRVCEQKINL